MNLDFYKSVIEKRNKILISYRKSSGVVVRRLAHPYAIGKTKYKHGKILLLLYLEREEYFEDGIIEIYTDDIEAVKVLDEVFTETVFGYLPTFPKFQDGYCAVPVLY